MTATLPNAIIAGVQKGATTALYSWLSQHPDIYGEPAMKDFPYFCSDEYLNKGTDWFAQRFAGHSNEAITLHGYVHYLFLTEQSADNILAITPDARLIVVLRNPIERAYSGYLQARKFGHERHDTFETAIQDDIDGNLSGFRSRTNRSYVSHGRYGEQLETLYQHFPREQVKVVLFEELNGEPIGTCKAIFAFLGVDAEFEINPIRKNDFGVPRSRILQQLIAGALTIGKLKELIPINRRIQLRRFLHNLNTRKAEKPEMLPATREMLKKMYTDDLLRVEAITGMDLSAWRN